MSAHKLLSRLPKAKQTGRGRWNSPCPAHQDKYPSLSIKELEDGRVLIHCFAGCTVADVVAAAGLSLEDLFPERLAGHSSPPERRAFYPADILRCIAYEALVVAIAANSVAHGEELPEADRKRLLIAASRLQAAMEMANGDA